MPEKYFTISFEMGMWVGLRYPPREAYFPRNDRRVFYGLGSDASMIIKVDDRFVSSEQYMGMITAVEFEMNKIGQYCTANDVESILDRIITPSIDL